jgi:1,2-dihydroxy-3-keto-5-methylthiopentene dioxygenase
MSRLTVFPEDSAARPELDTSDPLQIEQALRASLGVRFERWQAARALAATDGDTEVLSAYQGEIDKLKRENAYQSVDVVRLLPDNPKAAEMRGKFLDEHTHDEDEVRFFVEGSGMFYLHAGGKVHLVLCKRNDLISVPAGVRHWFDMGPAPHFTAVRLFTRPDGWVARFTGDTIARRFPSYDSRAE